MSNPSEQATVTLVPFAAEHVPAMFALIDADRAHLNAFEEGTADKYPTEQALLDSVTAPRQESLVRERFVIVSALAQGPVGTINATPTDRQQRNYNIGYWIGREHIGHGYAVLAVQSLATLLLERPATVSMTAQTHPDNVFSQRVLEGAGFLCTTRARKSHYFYRQLREPAPKSE